MLKNALTLNDQVYIIQGKKLGEGRYAAVYPARRKHDRKLVALKVMHSPDSRIKGIANLEDRTRAFENEVAFLLDPALNNLSWVIRLYDHGRVCAGRFNQRPVIVLELLPLKHDLENLKKRQERLGVRESLVLCAQLYIVLAKAHAAKIAYRDFKKLHFFWNPERKELKVIDWNVAIRPYALGDDQRDVHTFMEQIGDVLAPELTAALGGSSTALQALEKFLELSETHKLALFSTPRLKQAALWLAESAWESQDYARTLRWLNHCDHTDPKVTDLLQRATARKRGRG